MKLSGTFVVRNIAGDTIAVPVGETAIKVNGMITLTEVGAFIWRQLEENTTVEELVKSITDEYQVEETTARKDLMEFLQNLKKVDLLQLAQEEAKAIDQAATEQ